MQTKKTSIILSTTGKISSERSSESVLGGELPIGKERDWRLVLEKGRKNASSSKSSSSSLSSSRENEQKMAALIDGGEVFFLSTAVAMKARQVYVEQRARTENENASVASSSGGALMDLPLYLAVVVGAVLRRASTSASGSGMFSSVFASGDKVKFPRAVNASAGDRSWFGAFG